MPVKQKKQSAEVATQVHIKIAEVRDNVVVLKDGSVRAVLEVSSVNFDLKSEREQNVIIYSFQDFLNSLEFPIQIVVRSRKLDIDGYLEQLEVLAQNQEDPLMKRQTEEYIAFIGNLVELADIMEKKFYVVVPHEPYRARKLNPIARFLKALNPADTLEDYKLRQREFESLKKGLNQRINSVRSGLVNCGLKVHRLNTHQLIELYYQIYNPLIAQNQKLNNLADLDIDVPPGAEMEDEEEDSGQETGDSSK